MKRTLFLSIMFCLMTIQVFADWKIVISTKTSEGTEYKSTFYIKDGILKQETPEMNVIIDLNRNSIIYSNTATRSYWEGSKENFEQEIEELMKMMMIEMVGEEGYKQMKEMEESENSIGTLPEIEINFDDESIALAGFSGNKHSVIVDGELTEELWLCKEIDAFNEFDFAQMGEMFGENDESSYVDTDEYRQMIKTKGFPIKEITYSFGEVLETVELVSAEDTALSDDIFKAPEGYKKSGLLELMGM